MTHAAIIIPVYNHCRTVGGVIEAALALGLPVVVVDDGSTDDTPRVLADIPTVTCLRHPVNQGKGAALRTGFAAASRMAAPWAVTLDGDGQHDPSDARRLLEAVTEATPSAGRPIVVGCRRGMGPQAPWTSRFGRAFSNFWVRCSGGARLSDSQSGFRAYPLPEALHMGVRSGGYQFEIEILVRAAWREMTVLEVPVGVTYHPPGGRISHFRPWADFWRNARLFARLIPQRLLLPKSIRRRI
jgi:glycosyltransferase involved in cell wall biosynthesis